MKEIREIIAENISSLRKQKKWTQFELAEKLNYSDKAVSKWERAESMPDVDSLYALSELFGVTVDYFFHEDANSIIEYQKAPGNLIARKILILCLLCTAAFMVSLCIFIYAFIKDFDNKDLMWLSFVWSAPVMCAICYAFFIKNKIWLGRVISISLFIWTFLTAVYLQCYFLENNIWIIYLIGLPLQASSILIAFLRKK